MCPQKSTTQPWAAGLRRCEGDGWWWAAAAAAALPVQTGGSGAGMAAPVVRAHSTAVDNTGQACACLLRLILLACVWCLPLLLLLLQAIGASARLHIVDGALHALDGKEEEGAAAITQFVAAVAP